MYKRLQDSVLNKEDNYVLPFFWLKINHKDSIVQEMDNFVKCGVKSLCVEARPYPEFAKESWFNEMDVIMAEAEKRGLTVWVLDDDHFPTGHCAGEIKKRPELRRWQIIERHIDVCGPMTDASLLVHDPIKPTVLDPASEEHKLIGIYMYKRDASGTGVSPENIVCLTDNVKDDFVYFDIPEGCHRVFFLYKSRAGLRDIYNEYMDFFNPEAIDLYINSVHEAHYKRYGDKFGTVFKGFFSDEPCFGNTLIGPDFSGANFGYNVRVGMPGFAYPWGDVILEKLNKRYGRDAMKYLPALWFDMRDVTASVRYNYMDAITTTYRDNFTRRVGDWCRAHNVQYIGHIIEDMNASGRMGYGPGHYFRALDGQDMSGVDVVLQQILPGFSELIHTSSTMGNDANPDFFNYVLAKLGSSMAHINPQNEGRAMCEVFGAYGWAADVRLMKFLMDHMLVRGINRFVPHAFSPDFPNKDCPPHFGAAEGITDPQYKSFGELMSYTNKVSHILSAGKHVCHTALLYHADAEWMNKYDTAMLTQLPAKVLYDAHVDYDIVPYDCFAGDAGSVMPSFKIERLGVFSINGCEYSCLVIPEAELLPPGMDSSIEVLRAHGVAVLRIGENADLENLAALTKAATPPDVLIKKESGNIPDLYVRHCHYVDGDSDIYMLVNESITDAIEFTATFSSAKAKTGTLHDFGSGESYSVTLDENGSVRIRLEKYQSLVLVLDGDASSYPMYTISAPTGELKCDFKIETAPHNDINNFTVFTEKVSSDSLPNVTGRNGIPSFSGIMRYTAKIDSLKAEKLYLSEVGSSAEVWLNGKNLGIRYSYPYVFDVKDAARDGENELIIEVSNTLANTVKDYFSKFLTIPRSGLFGPILTK